MSNSVLILRSVLRFKSLLLFILVVFNSCREEESPIAPLEYGYLNIQAENAAGLRDAQIITNPYTQEYSYKVNEGRVLAEVPYGQYRVYAYVKDNFSGFTDLTVSSKDTQDVEIEMEFGQIINPSVSLSSVGGSNLSAGDQVSLMLAYSDPNTSFENLELTLTSNIQPDLSFVQSEDNFNLYTTTNLQSGIHEITATVTNELKIKDTASILVSVLESGSTYLFIKSATTKQVELEWQTTATNIAKFEMCISSAINQNVVFYECFPVEGPNPASIRNYIDKQVLHTDSVQYQLRTYDSQGNFSQSNIVFAKGKSYFYEPNRYLLDVQLSEVNSNAYFLYENGLDVYDYSSSTLISTIPFQLLRDQLYIRNQGGIDQAFLSTSLNSVTGYNISTGTSFFSDSYGSQINGVTGDGNNLLIMGGINGIPFKYVDISNQSTNGTFEESWGGRLHYNKVLDQMITVRKQTSPVNVKLYQKTGVNNFNQTGSFTFQNNNSKNQDYINALSPDGQHMVFGSMGEVLDLNNSFTKIADLAYSNYLNYAYNQNSTRLYAAKLRGRKIHVFNTSNYSLIDSIAVSGQPIYMFPVNNQLVVINRAEPEYTILSENNPLWALIFGIEIIDL